MADSRAALIVDDEPSICWGFEQMLGEEGITVISCASAEEGIELARQHRPSLIVLDVRLPGMDGLTAIPKFAEASPHTPIIVMTAFGDLSTAVQAVRHGAADYLTKPFGIDRARAICRTVLEQQAVVEQQADRPSGRGVPGDVRLVGSTPAMQELYRRIAMVAASPLPVLIRGETGTGKKLVAAAIHGHSGRRGGPYLTCAPAALEGTLAESELFGHVRGAFAGADQDREGLCGLADGGTLLLDRVGDLPLSAQAKLLHLLDQRSYTPLGSNQPRRCDVRLLATSDIDLAVAVAAGEFRSDLHQRLSAVRVDVPPLRERLDDLELLVQHFLKMADHEHAELPVEPAVLERLRIFSWPGNVRQLRSVVEHAAVVSRGRPLTCDHLPPLETQRHAASMVGGTHGPATTLTAAVGAWTEEACQQEGAMDLLNRFLATVEPTLLETVLKHTDGNRLAAAELLGIHRGTLRDRLRRYGIQP